MAIWPKSSPNLNSCSIKISHRGTSLWWLCYPSSYAFHEGMEKVGGCTSTSKKTGPQWKMKMLLTLIGVIKSSLKWELVQRIIRRLMYILCLQKSVNKLNNQEHIDGSTKEPNRPSKEHMCLIHNGTKYFLEKYSWFFEIFLVTL